MSPSTWIFLRSAGRAWAAIGHRADSAPLSNLRTEIQHARSEGATWQQIAGAAMLSESTVRKYGATREAAAQ